MLTAHSTPPFGTPTVFPFSGTTPMKISIGEPFGGTPATRSPESIHR